MRCWTDAAAEVQHAPDSRWVAARSLRRLVDAALTIRQGGEVNLTERRNPAVPQAASQSEHPGAIGADPDLDRVHWQRAGVVAVHDIVTPSKSDRSLPAPRSPDDRDRLFKGFDRLSPAADHDPRSRSYDKKKAPAEARAFVAAGFANRKGIFHARFPALPLPKPTHDLAISGESLCEQPP